MHTDRILQLALDMAGLDTIPEDTQVYVPGEISKALVCIDADTGLLQIARDLGYDGVIVHHPQGDEAMLGLHLVMKRQICTLMRAGVPEDVAREALKPRQFSVERNNHMRNWDYMPSVARLMRMPFMNVHYPCDLMMERIVDHHVQTRLTAMGPSVTVQQLVDILLEIPEYAHAKTRPAVVVGDPSSPAGKVVTAFAGGTNGGAAVVETYWRYGVGTVMTLHMEVADILKLRQSDIQGNLIVAGHMACDSVGLNALIRVLRQNGLDLTAMGGIVPGV
jgi:putative NIF3 family GTP cyclohydrolase 1 type 2